MSGSNQEPEWRDFCAEYTHDNKSWGGIDIRATSWEDAQARLRAIGRTGQVYGVDPRIIHLDNPNYHLFGLGLVLGFLIAAVVL